MDMFIRLTKRHIRSWKHFLIERYMHNSNITKEYFERIVEGI